MSNEQWVMTNDFRFHNVIYIVYHRKNENHWSLLVIRYHYLLLIIRNTNTPPVTLLLIFFSVEENQ